MINCIIVEDEPLAAEILQDYIKQIPALNLVATCSDAIYAMGVMQEKKIDLLFLDIHLPGMKGLDFLRSVASPPNVILTTAYHEYAVEGYELSVIDYLLKPIEFKRFLAAVSKFKKPSSEISKKTTITIHADKKKVVIPINEILFIESQKEYIKIQTLSEAYSTKYALSKVEEELDPELFFRVHRSFIVALKKIKAFNAHEIELPGKLIPIGGNYRDTVAKKLMDI